MYPRLAPWILLLVTGMRPCCLMTEDWSGLRMLALPPGLSPATQSLSSSFGLGVHVPAASPSRSSCIRMPLCYFTQWRPLWLTRLSSTPQRLSRLWVSVCMQSCRSPRGPLLTATQSVGQVRQLESSLTEPHGLHSAPGLRTSKPEPLLHPA